MQQYLLQSSLDTSHTATSKRYSTTHVITCNYQRLRTAGLEGKSANYSLESSEKINSVIYGKLYFFTFQWKQSPDTTLWYTNSHHTFQQFNILLRYLQTQSHVLLNAVFVKILLEYFHDMSNTVHPYKHHSHAQT